MSDLVVIIFLKGSKKLPHMGRRFWSVWLLVALALQLSGVFHFTYVFFGLEADEIHGKIQQQQKPISKGSEASSRAKQRK